MNYPLSVGAAVVVGLGISVTGGISVSVAVGDGVAVSVGMAVAVGSGAPAHAETAAISIAAGKVLISDLNVWMGRCYTNGLV
jgi:hypothetical protein